MTQEIPFRVRQMADELAARLARPASRMMLGGPEPKGPLASWFGRVTLAEPGERWPTWNGRPMWPLCQIVVRDMPFIPECIADLALIRVFIDPEFYQFETDNGEGWAVLASASLEGLVEVAPPDHGSEIKPLPGRWQLLDRDLPDYEDLSPDVPREVLEAWMELELGAADGAKVGGWPYLVQAEIYWAPGNRHRIAPEYVFQIDSEAEAGWMWGDSGVAHFGRGTGAHRDHWAMEWQCC